jgi:hypothetical protein
MLARIEREAAIYGEDDNVVELMTVSYVRECIGRRIAQYYVGANYNRMTINQARLI